MEIMLAPLSKETYVNERDFIRMLTGYQKLEIVTIKPFNQQIRFITTFTLWKLIDQGTLK